MSEYKLNNFFELAPNGITCIDINNKFVSVNNTFEKITGYSKSKLESSSIERVFPDSIVESFKNELKLNDAFIDLETKILTKKGDLVTVFLNGTLIQYENELNLWLIVQDQTRVNKERDALIGYKKFFSLNENMMSILSQKGNFLKINKKVPKVLGYSEDYLLSIPFLKLFHPKDINKADAAFQKVFNGEVMVNFKSRVLTQSKEEKHFLFSSTYDNTTGYVYVVARDITEAELSQKYMDDMNAKIKEQEYKYRQLFEKSGDAILIIKNGIFIDCNQAAIELFRAENKSYFIGESPLKISPKIQPNGTESKQKIKDMLDVVIKKGVNKFECNYMRKNGEIFPVEVFLTIIKNKNENEIIHCILRDLTEKIEKSLALKEQLRRNKRLISTTLDGYILTNEKGKILEVNKSYAIMIGYSERELLSRNINDIELTMSPITLNNRSKEIDKYEKSKFETKHVCKNGDIIFVEVSLALIKLKGKSTKTAQFIRNITDRKKAELRKIIYNNISQTLNSKISVFEFCKFIESELRKILSIYSFYVFLFNKKNKYLSSIYINDKNVESHEHINREKGNGLCEFVVNKSQELKLESSEIDAFIRKNNLTNYGESKTNWIGVPLISENEVLGVLTIKSKESHKPYSNLDLEILKFIGVQLGRLISRKENAYNLKLLNSTLEEKVYLRTQELEKAKENLSIALEKEKELGELKSKFVSTASHQFRTPLTVIQTSMGVLELQKNKMNEDFAKSFSKITERIKIQISQMTTMMDDLLTIGKINENGIDFNPKHIDVFLLVSQISENYNTIQKDNRKLEVVVNGENENIFVDPKLMEHALSALVSNAFKYSNSFQNPELIISFYSDYCELIVKDYGIGIASKDIDLIFEPFFRASNALNYDGTGLGTAIIKEYIEINKGTIQINSKINKGTEFIIRIRK